MFSMKSDSEKLRYLYDTVSSRMFMVAKSILKDEHLAEDVVQEVMFRISRVEIMKKLDEMTEADINAYLLKTTRHIAINFYVKRKREAGVSSGDYNEEAINNIPTEDCADTVINRMEEEKLFGIVADMPEKYAYVLSAKYRRNLSDKQIAIACGISEAAVRKRLERGRKMLKDKLEKRHYFDGDDRFYKKGGK